MNEIIDVGILFAEEIHFRLNGFFQLGGEGKKYSGDYRISKKGDTIFLTNATMQQELSLPLEFVPIDYKSADFDLLDVTIGIDFHWERQENQKFKGRLKIIEEKIISDEITDDDTMYKQRPLLTAINSIPLEEYLVSVISSEMSATSSIELLKAHAVISRSWLLAQKANAHSLTKEPSYISIEGGYLRWYDREDHANFDVCADDHCQRYQGITKAYTPEVHRAVLATKGEVLLFNGEICDTRFSKCCGGVTEKFENTWQSKVHPYLTAIIDSAKLNEQSGKIATVPQNVEITNTKPDDLNKTHSIKREHDYQSPPDLSGEEAAEAWILSEPEVFCNTHDKEILQQVLNNYDRETSDFFRWELSYTNKELSQLLLARTGIEFGEIIALIPIERGASGRIIKLKIVGTKQTLIIGKELEIRKSLSHTHLYSSAFIVKTKYRRDNGEENFTKIEKQIDSLNTQDESDNIPHIFTLHGAGWGHGVGLCQIGAAVMSHKGFTYKEILQHYFPGSDIVKI